MAILPSSSAASATGPTITGLSGTIPVRTDESCRRHLAVVLRRVRSTTRLGPEAFAHKANLSVAALRDAESGATLPSRAVLHGYLNAAELDDAGRAQVRQAWDHAYRDHQREALAPHASVVSRLPRHRRRASSPGTPAASARRRSSWPDSSMWPDPATIDTLEHWSQLLQAVKNGAAMSYTEIEKSSQELGHPLSRSRVHALCTKPALPANPDTVRAFILVCGGSHDDAERWHLAWQRLRMATDQRPHGGTESTGSPAASASVAAEDNTLPSSAAMLVTTRNAGTARIAERSPLSAAYERVAWSARTVPLRATVPIGALLFLFGLLSGLFTGVTLTH